MSEAHDFLSRFVGRGWLHATRIEPSEQAAVDLGLRKRWLRRELGEVHFTPKGRAALASPTTPDDRGPTSARKDSSNA